MTQGPQWLPAHDDQDEHSADYNQSFSNEYRLDDDHSAYNTHKTQDANNDDNTHRWLMPTMNMVCMIRPVARFFYGEVPSNEETDQMWPKG